MRSCTFWAPRPGTEVMVPATAPLPTAFPILTTGATPVIVDVAEGALGLNPVDVARKLTRTVAALSLPLWGYPAGVAPARQVLADAGIPVVEDAAPGPRHARRRPSCGNPRNRRVLLHPRPQTAFHRRRRVHPHRRRHPGGEGRELYPAGPPHRQQHGVNYKLAAPLAAIGLSPPARAGGADHGLPRQANARAVLSELPAGSTLANSRSIKRTNRTTTASS